MFLIHQDKSKGISISLLLGRKKNFDCCFDQLAPSSKGRRKKGGKGGQRVSRVFSVLFISRKNLTSELIGMAFSVEIQYFCWTKCKNVLSHGISHSRMEQFFILQQLPQLLIWI